MLFIFSENQLSFQKPCMWPVKTTGKPKLCPNILSSWPDIVCWGAVIFRPAPSTALWAWLNKILKPGKTRKHVSRNTHNTHVFPMFPSFATKESLFPVSIFVSKMPNLLLLYGRNIPCFLTALNHGKTRKQWWKQVSSFCQALSIRLIITNWLIFLCLVHAHAEICAAYAAVAVVCSPSSSSIQYNSILTGLVLSEASSRFRICIFDYWSGGGCFGCDVLKPIFCEPDWWTASCG